MEIIFYSTHCPRCAILEKKLKQKNIEYIENNDVAEMLRIGLSVAPALKVDGELMNFKTAVNWINEYNSEA